MHASIVKDIKDVLNTTYTAINKKNYFALEELSNRLNHSAAIHQSKEISICSVAVFALSKIFDKQDYLQHPDFNEFRNNILKQLTLAIKAVGVNGYLGSMKVMESQIQKFSAKIKTYHMPLLTYARSVKAKHVVEHGLSVSQASKLFGVPEWDISAHMGKSKAHEKHHASPQSNRERIKLVRRLFGA